MSSFLQAVFEYFIYISYIVGQGFMRGTSDQEDDVIGIGRDEYEGEYEYSESWIKTVSSLCSIT